MKNDKKVFFLIEAVLGIMVVVLAFLMLQEKNGKDLAKVSIILQNSEDNQWAGFKYGLKWRRKIMGLKCLWLQRKAHGTRRTKWI